MSSNCFKTIIFYLLCHMSCLLICKDINSAYLKGKNMLMNVFNTHLLLRDDFHIGLVISPRVAVLA